MSSAQIRQVTLDFAEMGFNIAVKAIISIRRTPVVNALGIIPEYTRIPIKLNNGIGVAYLLDNTIGSVYECIVLDENDDSLLQFFFLVDGYDFNITDKIKYTAWPEQEEPIIPVADDTWQWESGDTITWFSESPILMNTQSGGINPKPPIYEHTQNAPSASWVINHNLGKLPITQVYTLGYEMMGANVRHTSDNQTVVSFDVPMKGIVIFA